MYDEIATLYHLVYQDWNAAIAQKAAALDALIRTHVGPPPRSILDVSCGIGTQALGLAALGYAVTASDLSPAAVERARREAAQRNLAIHFTVADMRRCAEVHGSGFDVVLSADNSIPHLLSDGAIARTVTTVTSSSRRETGMATSMTWRCTSSARGAVQDRRR